MFKQPSGGTSKIACGRMSPYAATTATSKPAHAASSVEGRNRPLSRACLRFWRLAGFGRMRFFLGVLDCVVIWHLCVIIDTLQSMG